MGILMGKNNVVRLAPCMIAGLLLAGCVGTPVTFPQVDEAVIDKSRGRTVRSSACGFQLLLLIPININDRAERAYAELREQAGTDILADVQVREKWFYGFVGTGYCTQLTARAFPRADAVSLQKN